MTNNDKQQRPHRTLSDRARFIALHLAEGVSLVLEQEGVQPPPQQQAPTQQPPAAPPVDSGIQEPAAPGTPSEIPMGTDGKPLSVDGLIERLNVIRGGKSFSDPEVYGQLTTLFKQITNEEKVSIDRVLTSIGKVVINAPEGQQTPVAEEPQAQPTAQAPQAQTAAQPTQQQPAPPAGAPATAPVTAV